MRNRVKKLSHNVRTLPVLVQELNLLVKQSIIYVIFLLHLSLQNSAVNDKFLQIQKEVA
jgi:hypothetical protein